MSTSIVGGVFPNAKAVEAELHDLQDMGFSEKDISIFAQDESQLENIDQMVDSDDVTTNTEDRGSNAGKGLGWGALSGGVLGGLAGLLAGGVAITIPGAAPLAVAGAGATGLLGAGAGAVGGGIVGVLVGAGLPEEQAKEFEQFIEDGKIVVLVKVNDAQRAQVEDSFRKASSEYTSTSTYVEPK